MLPRSHYSVTSIDSSTVNRETAGNDRKGDHFVREDTSDDEKTNRFGGHKPGFMWRHSKWTKLADERQFRNSPVIKTAQFMM